MALEVFSITLGHPALQWNFLDDAPKNLKEVVNVGNAYIEVSPLKPCHPQKRQGCSASVKRHPSLKEPGEDKSCTKGNLRYTKGDLLHNFQAWVGNLMLGVATLIDEQGAPTESEREV